MLARDLPEPPLNEVQPRGTRQGKVQMKSRFWFTSNVRRVLHESDLIGYLSVIIIDFEELLCRIILQPSVVMHK
ncbi:hypothetical protein COMA2_90089 [Candidatus Nitrospira nitrificans]|uniref:Uncharacterized protein n=1 Tax=Candidatus Nitrospira nitrificans TaxID=1742973 RepID=A0A0S4LVQ4_9BACT|nr:hypothetical protein COMA2_90089 [Candidatus Nitrospira nitrificans]